VTKGDKKKRPESIRKKKFILVADNSQRDGNYTAMLLQNFGYNTTTVRTGSEALDFLSIAAPALVISELILPDMSGIDLYNRMKQHHLAPAAPVFIQTRFADVQSQDQCRRAGCAGCLNKPLQTSELYRAVQQALEPTPRQNIRVATALNASVDGTSSDTSTVISLSDSGLFIRTLEPHPVGTEHAVTFVLKDRMIRADAVVLYVYRFGEAMYEEPGMGMKFLNLSVLDRDAIQSFIHEGVNPAIERKG